MTTKFELIFHWEDNNKNQFKIHPQVLHMSSRLRNIRGFVRVKDYFGFDHISIIAEGGNLNELQNAVLDYLTNDRGIDVLNVTRKQVELLGRSHTGSLANYLNGTEE